MLRIILFFFNQFSYISSKVAVSVIFRQSSSLWICTISYLHDLFLFDTHIWEIILIIVCVSADILMLEFFTREIGIIPKESSIGQRRDKTTPWYRTWTWQRPKILLPLRTQRTYSKCWFWEYWSFNKLRWIFFYTYTQITHSVLEVLFWIWSTVKLRGKKIDFGASLITFLVSWREFLRQYSDQRCWNCFPWRAKPEMS